MNHTVGHLNVFRCSITIQVHPRMAPKCNRGLFLVQIKEHVCRCLLCAIASMVMFCALGILNNVGNICTLQSSIHHVLKDNVKCRWSLTIEMTTWYRIICSRKRFRSELWIFNQNFHEIYCYFVCKKLLIACLRTLLGAKCELITKLGWARRGVWRLQE